MNVKEEYICRLCLNVADNDFEKIDNITRKIFYILRLKVDLDVSKDPIMCKNCVDVVSRCFDFKSNCIDTEEVILSFTVGKKRATFDLKDIYEHKKGVRTVGEERVCRFCLNVLKLEGGGFVLLDALTDNVTFANMLQELMQHADFKIVKNPVICASCRHNLECYVKFIENCLDVEDKIIKYCRNEGAARVKLNDLLLFLFKNILELDHAQIRAIKEEADEFKDIEDRETYPRAYYDEFMDVEEKIDIKEHGILNNDGTSRTLIRNSSVTEDFSASSFETGQEHTPIDEASSETCTFRKKELYVKLYKECIAEAQPFKCAMCTFETKRKKHLIKHTLIHKNVTEMVIYKCSKCTFQTKHKNSLKGHMLIHKATSDVNLYTCAKCDFKSKRKQGIRAHMTIHKSITEVETHKCPKCTYVTRYKGTLQRHITVMHKEFTDVEMHKCPKCAFATKHKSNLTKHAIIHEDVSKVEMYECSMCAYKTIRKAGLKKHRLTHIPTTDYKCTMCTFKTKTSYGIKTHMLVHRDVSELEIYKCATCNYQTIRKGGLRAHMLTHRPVTEVEMYKCSKCAYQTRNKYSLAKHETLMHRAVSEVRMFKCPKCVFETKHRNSLGRHMLIHKDGADVEIYKCSRCSFESKHKESRNRHTMIHKGVEEVKSYKCLVCSYETIHKSSLRKHIFRKHTPRTR